MEEGQSVVSGSQVVGVTEHRTMTMEQTPDRRWSWSSVLVSMVMLLGLGSCRNSAEPTTGVAFADSLVFHTGFPLSYHLTGVCQQFKQQDTSELVYFADVITNKRITVFTANGELLYTIPLDIVLDSLGKISGVAFLHPDTILVAGTNSNKLAIIDRLGSCSVVADLTESLRLSNGLTYELRPSFFTPFVVGHRACFHVSLLYGSIGSYFGQDAPQGDMYKYEWLVANGPHFASVDLGSIYDSLRLDWGPAMHRPDTNQALAHVQRVRWSACVNGQWFTFNINSPVVRTLDPTLMTLEREFTVRSAFGPVYREPIMIPKDGLLTLGDSLKERMENGGFIETIHYDHPTKRYLVVLRHRRMDRPGEELRGGYTLQQYDEDFSLIKETTFTTGKYRMPMMLSLRNGTYVMREETKRERMNGIHVFNRILLDGK
ncbi:MAG: hypothetical protein KJZ58_09790 [Flavobacteriales bacterium]|nr:hypothetical protein [Flavobacteriales bacterium]